MNDAAPPIDLGSTRSSLLERVRDPRDSEAWREFVVLYQPLLIGYARKLGFTGPDALDVVQEILLLLVRELPRFQLDHQAGRFRTWLYTVTRNKIRDRQRRQARAKEVVLDEELEPAVDAADARELWERNYREHVLRQVLDDVREGTQLKTWQCFELHLLMNQPAKDVGATLGLNLSAVYANTSRVLARVKERCAELMESTDHDLQFSSHLSAH